MKFKQNITPLPEAEQALEDAKQAGEQMEREINELARQHGALARKLRAETDAGAVLQITGEMDAIAKRQDALVIAKKQNEATIQSAENVAIISRGTLKEYRRIHSGSEREMVATKRNAEKAEQLAVNARESVGRLEDQIKALEAEIRRLEGG